MTDLLTELLNAGLIDKLDGNDDRFTKMEKAAEAIAQELRDKPPLLIRAILAGLDPDIPADDPALVQAEQALLNEWQTMRSVHTDRPVNLLRAILLAACNLVADAGDNAEILWLTAADTLPLLRLGKEEWVIREMLKALVFILSEDIVSYELPASNVDILKGILDQLNLNTLFSKQLDSKFQKVGRDKFKALDLLRP